MGLDATRNATHTPLMPTATNLVTRQTSKGLLLVAITPSGDLAATLAGRMINSGIVPLRAPFAGPLGLVTHDIGGCALYAAEHAAIEAAQAPYLTRLALVCASNTDAFPGSRAWTAAQDAAARLAAFDLAHPEILAAAQAAHAAEMASRYQD